jgi:hypothetical protein
MALASFYLLVAASVNADTRVILQFAQLTTPGWTLIEAGRLLTKAT